MKVLRISAADRGMLKVHHTRYLRDVIGLRLRDAKRITDDVLEGIARDVCVPDDLAEIHEKTLRLLGVRVELLGPLDELATTAL